MCHAYAHEVQSFLTGVDAKGKTAKIDSKDDFRVLGWLAAWSGAAPQQTRDRWFELNETCNNAALTDAEQRVREWQARNVVGLRNKLDAYVLDMTTYGRAYDDLDKLSLLKGSLGGVPLETLVRPVPSEVVWTEYSAAARARRRDGRALLPHLGSTRNVFAFPRRT
ncbi:hypothetical protein JCM10450v2_006918 [Rhodotorula kratochvilovae]